MSLRWRIIGQVNEEKGVSAWERKPVNRRGYKVNFSRSKNGTLFEAGLNQEGPTAQDMSKPQNC